MIKIKMLCSSCGKEDTFTTVTERDTKIEKHLEICTPEGYDDYDGDTK